MKKALCDAALKGVKERRASHANYSIFSFQPEFFYSLNIFVTIFIGFSINPQHIMMSSRLFVSKKYSKKKMWREQKKVKRDGKQKDQQNKSVWLEKKI